jgi:hypothetical protein
MNPTLCAFVREIVGMECWYVSCGGCTLPTFQLALGARVPRSRPVSNPAHTEEYRRFEGEGNLLVWCSWRLDRPDQPLTSSDDTAEAIPRELGRLIGARVEAVTVAPPGWDLAVSFSGGLCLRVFADHIPGDPSADGNWELWRPHAFAWAGPGAAYAIEPREVEEPAARR